MKQVSLNPKDFPVLNMYTGSDGGVIYTAEKDGLFYVIMDESSIASFLSKEDMEYFADYPLTTTLMFDSAQERTGYLMERFGPGKETQPYDSLDLKQLKTMGFRWIGEWKLEKDELGFYIKDHHYESANILYAFICQGSLVYLDKTDRPLEKHFWDFKYKDPNLSNLIREALLSWKPIEIYALPDNGLLYFGGFQINLADGLFDSMISELNPAWNCANIVT